MHYDIIGDIHGHSDALRLLLTKMSYEERNGSWRHPERTAIFLGDFIDRGPKQVETVTLVRKMVESDAAKAIMGNHEFNAIAWYLKHPKHPRRHLRTHTGRVGQKNFEQHQRFLIEAKSQPGQHKSIIDWFLTLPLWLDLPELRVVHACWHQGHIDYLQPRLARGGLLTPELMLAASQEPKSEREKDNANPTVFKSLEVLTKGIEASLPSPHSFQDADGHTRRRVRLAWWNSQATTLGDAALLSNMPAGAWKTAALSDHVKTPYPTNRPLFFGHYWRKGVPTLLTDRVACLDYSIAKGGKLVAYRLSDEQHLDVDHLVWV